MAATPYRELFENKKTKRNLHREFTDRILSFGDKGCVVSLCGPAMETHYKELKPLLRKNSQMLFAEINPKVIENERLAQRTEALGDRRVKFFAGNVWDGIHLQYLRRQGWHHKHVLFDLDFCCTAETAIKRLDLYSKLETIAASKLPRKNGFWISVTFCRWGDKNNRWRAAISEIIHIFAKHNWELSFNHNAPYAEKGGNKEKRRLGANMLTMVFRFRWNYTKIHVKPLMDD